MCRIAQETVERQTVVDERDGGHFVGIFHADFARLHTLPTASTMKMAAMSIDCQISSRIYPTLFVAKYSI